MGTGVGTASHWEGPTPVCEYTLTSAAATTKRTNLFLKLVPTSGI